MRLDYLLIGGTIALAVVACAIAIVIFVRIPRRNGLSQIGFLFVLEAVYAFGYALELMSETELTKVLSNRVQYLAIPFLSTIWLIIAIRFKTPSYHFSFKKHYAFLIVPLLVFFAAQLSYFTSLDWYYKSFDIDGSLSRENFGLAILVIEKGFLYFVNAVYNVILVLIVTGMYAKIFMKSSGIQKKQSFAMMVCSAITAVATIPIFLTTHTLGIDLSLYLYAILGYIILYATVNYEVFDLAPLAHRATFEYSTDPMLLLDERFEIISWNQAIQSFRTKPLMYRMPLKRYIRDDEVYSAILMKQTSTFIIKEKRYIIEIIDLKTRRGRINGYLVKFNDMTAYLEKIERLDFDASHDALTKLLNRRAFFERVDRYFQSAVGSQELFAVLMIDIDDFKLVNDTHGHLVGDLLLEDLSNVLYRNLPDNAIFSRYGGEEFVGLLPRVHREEALRLSDVARVAVENRWFTYGEINIQIRVSIGVSHGVVDGYQDIMYHIHQADMGMYQAKNSGKNCVMYASPNQN